MRARIHKISRHVPSIFQGRLDFNTTQHRISLSIEHPAELLALRVLAIALIALVCGYLYFVSASVLNVMSRKEALTRTALIQGSIGGLEQEYFKLSQSVKPNSGAALGLSPVSQTQYVYRPGNVGAVTIVRNEI
ncbi:MAG: hypothetical protein Q7S50_04820 [bacterium]|nr:hypothetical protein [bacterium]